MFDREEVLGRDASSVFPTESKAPAMDSATVNQLLGSNLRFITESEVCWQLSLVMAAHNMLCLAQLDLVGIMHYLLLGSMNKYSGIDPWPAAGGDQGRARGTGGGWRGGAREAPGGGAAGG